MTCAATHDINTSTKTVEVIRMKTENREQSIEELQARNEFLQRMVNALKLNNRELTEERNRLCNKNIILSGELAYFQTRCAELEDKLNNVTLWDLSEAEQEKAGRALARSLLGGA